MEESGGEQEVVVELMVGDQKPYFFLFSRSLSLTLCVVRDLHIQFFFSHYACRFVDILTLGFKLNVFA